MTEGWIASELEECRLRFETGDYPAIAEAFSLCAWNGIAPPAWMEKPILDSLLFSLNHGGANQGGRGGGHRVQTGLAGIHRLRAQVYELELKQGKHGAAERASEALAGTQAQGSPRQIKRSFDKVKSTTNQG